MKQKFTIHRALALKKTTAERIEDTIMRSKFIDVCQGRKKTINGVDVSKIEDEIRANYEKVNHLISNYVKLKKALLASNAGVRDYDKVEKVTVAGNEYTMAELIDMSDNVYGNNKHVSAFKVLFLRTLSRNYTNAIETVDRAHRKVEADIKEYLAKAAGSDKSMSSEEIRKRSDMFHEDGDMHLVDPLNLKEVIDKLDAEIKAFRADCDATMSEQNALTVIEVDLTNVD